MMKMMMCFFFSFLSLLSFRAFFFLFSSFVRVIERTLSFFCVRGLFLCLFLGGLLRLFLSVPKVSPLSKVFDKKIILKVSNPHKKTPSRVRHHHHHRARGHKDVL